MVVVFFSQVHGHKPINRRAGTLHNYNDDLRVAINGAIADDPLDANYRAFHRL
jgi:hypothetical protein